MAADAITFVFSCQVHPWQAAAARAPMQHQVLSFLDHLSETTPPTKLSIYRFLSPLTKTQSTGFSLACRLTVALCLSLHAHESTNLTLRHASPCQPISSCGYVLATWCASVYGLMLQISGKLPEAEAAAARAETATSAQTPAPATPAERLLHGLKNMQSASPGTTPVPQHHVSCL